MARETSQPYYLFLAGERRYGFMENQPISILKRCSFFVHKQAQEAVIFVSVVFALIDKLICLFGLLTLVNFFELADENI